MGGKILVSGGDGRGTISAELVGHVHDSWVKFLEYLSDERSANNDLKEWIARVKVGLDELYISVRALPPQGRNVAFTGHAIARMSSLLREVRSE